MARSPSPSPFPPPPPPPSSLPLTTERFIDALTPLATPELTALRHLSVKDYPFPLDHPQDEGYYTTHLFPSLLGLFPGLQLSVLDIEDAFHGSSVTEDGWGHNTTYDAIGDLIKHGKGWTELVFRSRSDRWFNSVTFTTSTAKTGESSEETVGRERQPETWRRWIEERDGGGEGAGVEMWARGKGGAWAVVEGDYVPRGYKGSDEGDGKDQDSYYSEIRSDWDGAGEGKFDGKSAVDGEMAVLGQSNEADVLGSGQEAGDSTPLAAGSGARVEATATIDSVPRQDQGTAPAIGSVPSNDDFVIIIRVRRGRGADYVQDGKYDKEDKFEAKLHDLFDRMSWSEIKEKGIFMPGAEGDPTAHL